jgi:glycosyltransferase involved in cell wall biosynthesis
MPSTQRACAGDRRSKAVVVPRPLPYLPATHRAAVAHAFRNAMASPVRTPAPASPAGQPSAKGLRVALYSGNYNSVRDGANKALNRLVAHLIERGATVRVYAPQHPQHTFEAPGEIVEVPSVPIPTRSEYRVTYGLTKAVRQDIAAFRPNVIHVSVPDLTAWQLQTFARKLGVPVLGSLHTLFETYLDYYGFGFARPWGERYLARFYGRCDLVLTPSSVLADDVRRSSHVPTAVWSRGVDREVFNPAHRDEAWRQSHGYRPEDVVVAYFGRLVLEKGTAIFAEIIGELRRRGHAVVPLVVGEGPERERLSEALGRAVFTRHVEGAELSRAVASADVMVNPSVTEAFGNVNLEAMAAGLAVVGADVPVVRTMIEDGVSGLVANPTSATDFADKVERLLLDPALRTRLTAGGRAVADRYDWTAILDSVVRDYLELVNRSAADAA